MLTGQWVPALLCLQVLLLTCTPRTLVGPVECCRHRGLFGGAVMVLHLGQEQAPP